MRRWMRLGVFEIEQSDQKRQQLAKSQWIWRKNEENHSE